MKSPSITSLQKVRPAASAYAHHDVWLFACAAEELFSKIIPRMNAFRYKKFYHDLELKLEESRRVGLYALPSPEKSAPSDPLTSVDAAGTITMVY